MKYQRQNQIINIVKSRPVHTHDELIALLRDEGHNVTQATVSRDIKELGLIKIQSGDGSQIYSVPEPVAENVARMDLVSDSVRQVVSALHTVVINTYPGMASAVAAAVDSAMRRDILGSIAGDDTVLIITASEERAAELAKRIRNSFKGE